MGRYSNSATDLPKLQPVTRLNDGQCGWMNGVWSGLYAVRCALGEVFQKINFLHAFLKKMLYEFKKDESHLVRSLQLVSFGDISSKLSLENNPSSESRNI